MTRDDIIRMAREQGLPETATEGVFRVNTDDLGRMIAAGCNALRARLEATEKEIAKLRIALAEKVTSEATLRGLNVGSGFINATFEEGAVQPMLDALADQFVESGSSNYIEMQLHSKTAISLLFTLQRVDGKTPHQLREEAEKERDVLRADLAAAEKENTKLREALAEKVTSEILLREFRAKHGFTENHGRVV